MVKSLAASQTVRVVAAVEPDAALGAPLCAGFGIRHFDSYADVLRDADVHAVILTTPNRLHEQQIVDAASHGKHVFCEKPLALNLASAERAVAACLRHGVRLGIGHERRFEPPMLLVRQLIADGSLGRVLHIEGHFSQNKFLALPPDNWRLSLEEAGCGPMTATGIHLLDLAGSIAGPALEVRASVSNLATGFASGDTASAHIVFGDGISATINAVLATPFYSRFAVFGSKGWIEVRDKSHVEAPSGWTVIRSAPGDKAEVHDLPVATPVRDNLEAFARAVTGAQEDYPVPIQQMLNTTSLLETVFEAAQRGGVLTPRLSTLLDRAKAEGAAGLA